MGDIKLSRPGRSSRPPWAITNSKSALELTLEIAKPTKKKEKHLKRQWIIYIEYRHVDSPEIGSQEAQSLETGACI